jgi:hypothetical protein
LKEEDARRALEEQGKIKIIVPTAAEVRLHVDQGRYGRHEYENLFQNNLCDTESVHSFLRRRIQTTWRWRIPIVVA